MNPAVITGVLALFGLLFGSFSGAQVWRLRARQLRDDDVRLAELKAKSVRSADEADELAYLTDDIAGREKERARLDVLLGSVRSDHSRCLSCQHQLTWYDLLPLVSWLSTKGRCRYCRAPIGRFEPLMELGVAGTFVLSYVLWPFSLTNGAGIVLFLVWLTAVVLLAILFAYDVKWFLLPDVIVAPLALLGVVMSGYHVVTAPDALSALLDVGGSVVVLSGLYGLLYFASRGRWVGFGDVKLGLGLALVLADWRLALLALFLANLIGSLVVIPSLVLGKLRRKAQVPFGPLLIAGTVIALLVGQRIIDSYMTLSF